MVLHEDKGCRHSGNSRKRPIAFTGVFFGARKAKAFRVDGRARQRRAALQKIGDRAHGVCRLIASFLDRAKRIANFWRRGSLMSLVWVVDHGVYSYHSSVAPVPG